MKKLNQLLQDHGKIYHKLRMKNENMIWGEKEAILFESATHCHICSNEFKNENEKIKDHDHFTGKFRGAACNKCNLNLKMPNFIQILIHNLKYDSKIFLRWLLKLCDEYEQKQDLNIIPKNNENYSTFSRKVVIDEYEQKYDLTKCLKCNKKYYDKILDKCPKCNEGNLNIKRKINKNIQFSQYT